MINWFKWRVAFFLQWLYGERVCWAQLVMWVEYGYWGRITFDTPCRDDVLDYHYPYGVKTEGDWRCYCGKFGRRFIPPLPPIFWITGH